MGLSFLTFPIVSKSSLKLIHISLQYTSLFGLEENYFNRGAKKRALGTKYEKKSLM